jgi:hypothetical protein
MRLYAVAPSRRSQEHLVRKYRSSVPFVVGLVVAIGFLLLGIAMAVPTSTSDVAEHVIGGFAIAAAVWEAAFPGLTASR